MSGVDFEAQPRYWFPKPYADFVQRLRVAGGFILLLAFAWLARPSRASLAVGLPVSLLGPLAACVGGRASRQRQGPGCLGPLCVLSQSAVYRNARCCSGRCSGGAKYLVGNPLLPRFPAGLFARRRIGRAAPARDLQLLSKLRAARKSFPAGQAIFGRPGEFFLDALLAKRRVQGGARMAYRGCLAVLEMLVCRHQAIRCGRPSL